MISSLNIRGYRGFSNLSMEGLGRVNLLVGTNNCGKTSVLEAIHLLTSAGDPSALWQLLWRRGERLPTSVQSPERPLTRRTLELDISHLFHGHEALAGSIIKIHAKVHEQDRMIEYALIEVQSREQPELFTDDDVLGMRAALGISGIPRPIASVIPLSRSAGLYADAIDGRLRRQHARLYDGVAPVMFITTESIVGAELVAMWNKIALTPHESLVLRALQFLEPKIERIAAQSSPDPYYSTQSRSGFILKLSGVDQPVPIGSMGDGMWRMLAMAIAITQCRGGVLLVDEIDTGLHYTVLTEMWRLIFNAAREFDVQVFATTHSSDCIRSLAELTLEATSSNDLSVQRIEADKSRAVRYDPEELSIASQREIEVR